MGFSKVDGERRNEARIVAARLDCQRRLGARETNAAGGDANAAASCASRARSAGAERRASYFPINRRIPVVICGR
jgi:hypothetical protein